MELLHRPSCGIDNPRSRLFEKAAGGITHRLRFVLSHPFLAQRQIMLRDRPDSVTRGNQRHPCIQAPGFGADPGAKAVLVLALTKRQKTFPRGDAEARSKKRQGQERVPGLTSLAVEPSSPLPHVDGGVRFSRIKIARGEKRKGDKRGLKSPFLIHHLWLFIGFLISAAWSTPVFANWSLQFSLRVLEKNKRHFHAETRRRGVRRGKAKSESPASLRRRFIGG